MEKKDCTPLEEAIAQEMFDTFSILVAQTNAYRIKESVNMQSIKNVLHDIISNEE